MRTLETLDSHFEVTSRVTSEASSRLIPRPARAAIFAFPPGVARRTGHSLRPLTPTLPRRCSFAQINGDLERLSNELRLPRETRLR